MNEKHEEQKKIEATEEMEKVEVKKKAVGITSASLFPAKKQEAISRVEPMW